MPMSPRPERHPTLRQRLVLRLLGPILLLTVLWGWAMHTIVLHFAGQAYDLALEDTAQTLAAQLRAERGVATVDLPDAARQMLVFDREDRIFFAVLSPQNEILIANALLPAPPTGHDASESLFYDGTLDTLELRLVESVIPVGADGAVYRVRIAETLHKRETLARKVLQAVLVAQLLFLAAAGLLMSKGVGRGIAPLQRVSRAIARRGQHDLSPIDEQRLPAEVFAQVHVINDLMRRLGEAFVAQRRFIADAAHQLRTPITVLHTQAQLALLSRDEADLRDAVRKIDGGAARLARLANQLLNLSRAEAAQVQRFDPVSIDPRALIEDIVALQVPLALQRGIEVSVELPPHLPPIPGNRDLLGEALANVVDNAIRYTPVGGRVVVSAQAEAARLCIRVTDSGPGIDTGDYEMALRPFQRGATAPGGGSGLGLAIANEVVAAHRGRLDLSPAPGRSGLMVTFELLVANQD
jgi:two-component system sensor histidine kinase TctE